MVTLCETRYTGWTVKPFHERWHQEHGWPRSYTWRKQTLQKAGASQEGAAQSTARHDTPSRWLDP
jgi:hypothetical protein